MKKSHFRLLPLTSREDRITPDPDRVATFLSLYDRGKYLDLYQQATAIAPLQRWHGPEAMVLAFRLCNNIGQPRTAALMILRARRLFPDHPEVLVHGGYSEMMRGGPLASWQWTDKALARKNLPPETRADLLAMKADVCGTFRDFENGWRFLNEAQSIAPESPWIRQQRASLLMDQHQFAEAETAAREALALRPWYRPTVQMLARILHFQNRAPEAIALLAEACQHLQSSAVLMQLITMRRETEDYDQMLGQLEQLREMQALSEPAFNEWVDQRILDAFVLKGERIRAAEHAEKLDADAYRDMALRLRDTNIPWVRVKLPVRFVAQQHNTCGPATLAALAQFMGLPIEQTQIIDAICYDGTYDFTERRWCTANGFAVREFAVTWDAARLLLDAGVPFALATVEAMSGHQQAVIGYDTLRESLLIQDPGEPHYREVNASGFLDRYKMTGPRGMVIVPRDRADWLASLGLPESEWFDESYEFALALEAYRREDAVRIIERMEERDPQHRAVVLSKISLASFDGNTPARCQAVSGLVSLFPQSGRAHFMHLMSLRELGTREERIKAAKTANEIEHWDPIFLKELAVEECVDSRKSKEALRLLQNAHLVMPSDASIIWELGKWADRQDQQSLALDCFRFAAALAEKQEGYARGWFGAACVYGVREQALEWLRKRVENLGERSSAPYITLISCLDSLNRNTEGMRVLEEACVRHPNDGELLLFASREWCSAGQLPRAWEALEKAQAHTNRQAWLRARAALLQHEGNLADTLAVWTEIAAAEPLAMDAYEAIAYLKGCVASPAAVLDFLAEAAQRFPHHFALNRLRLEWCQRYAPDEVTGILRHLVTLDPADAWTRRELALHLDKPESLQEALTEARLAMELAPHESSAHAVLAILLKSAGEDEPARTAMREALRININNAACIRSLGLDWPENDTKRLQELDFIRSEMIRQVITGAAISAYRAAAFPVLDPAVLESHLTEIHSARSDLWEAWAELARHLLDRESLESAVKIVDECARRFPLVPGSWRLLGTIRLYQKQGDAAIEAFRQGLQLNPNWDVLWRQLADVQENMGRADDSVETLRIACRRLPLDHHLQVMLAGVLWRAGQREPAWSELIAVLQAAPENDEAWGMLYEYAGLLNRRDAVFELARGCTVRRPGDAATWRLLARILPPESWEEKLAAINTAIRLHPTFADHYDYRATLLARVGRIADARKSIGDGPWKELPLELQGRRVWLLSMDGHVEEALRSMHALCRQHRHYYWGWECCVEWAHGLKNQAILEEATAALARLAPRNPDALAAEADALKGRHPTRATELYMEALEHAPWHVYSALAVLRLSMNDRKPEKFEAIARMLMPTGPTRDIADACQLMAARLRRDKTPMPRLIAALSRSDTMPLDCAKVLYEVFVQGVDRALAKLFLQQGFEGPIKARTIGPAFAQVYVTRECLASRYRVSKHFRSWIDRMGEHAVPVILEFLNLIGDARKASEVQPALESCGAWMKAHTQLWGAMAYALCNSAEWRLAREWLGDATQRADAEPWMLANLIVCSLNLKDDETSKRVANHMMETGMKDNAFDWPVSIAAYFAAMAGETQTARAHLARYAENDSWNQLRILRMVAMALCEVLEDHSSNRPAAFRRHHQQLRDAASRVAATPWAGRLYKQAIQRMRKHCGVWLFPWSESWPR